MLLLNEYFSFAAPRITKTKMKTMKMKKKT